MATLERLGLIEALEEVGAVHNHTSVWTRYGWVAPRPGPDYPHPAHGFNIRRQTFDPMLRTLAANTPGVDLLLGTTAKELLNDGDRVAGVIAQDRHGNQRRLAARLTVAADGRDSTVAHLAASSTKRGGNARFMYWAYYTGLQLGSGNRSQAWLMDPDAAYTFPNEDGVPVVAVMPMKERLGEFKRDLEGAFIRYVYALPDQAPAIHDAERVSPFIGKLDLTNHSRKPARPGLAFVGDAAMTSDPLWGVGCGWALQSAEWLADIAGPALLSLGDLDAALRRYSRLHRRRLGAHHWLVCDYSSGRGFNPFEKMLFRAAANDPTTALAFHSFGNRTVPVHQLFSPRVLGRMARVANRSRRANNGENAMAA